MYFHSFFLRNWIWRVSKMCRHNQDHQPSLIFCLTKQMHHSEGQGENILGTMAKKITKAKCYLERCHNDSLAHCVNVIGLWIVTLNNSNLLANHLMLTAVCLWLNLSTESRFFSHHTQIYVPKKYKGSGNKLGHDITSQYQAGVYSLRNAT